MYLPNGGLIKTDYTNPDTDGDGLKDGEEIDMDIEAMRCRGGVKYYFLYSSYPDRVDSDGDGVQDWDESLLNRLIYNEFAFVLFDNEDFSRQGNDEGKLLKTVNPDLEVRILPINNKSEFTKYWNLYSGINADISLIFHGSTNYLWIVDDELMKEEISSLQTARIKTLRLLSCNGGHKDVEDNFAKTLLKYHYIAHLYAMDGMLML